VAFAIAVTGVFRALKPNSRGRGKPGLFVGGTIRRVDKKCARIAGAEAHLEGRQSDGRFLRGIGSIGRPLNCWIDIRGAQTGVFELDIRISNPPYIHRCESLAAETGLKARNVEKRINDV
jgi:hypothetical protein